MRSRERHALQLSPINNLKFCDVFQGQEYEYKKGMGDNTHNNISAVGLIKKQVKFFFSFSHDF